jgi:hypothetical protein
MAMVNIEIDTSKKTISTSVDGKKYANIRSIYFVNDEYGFGLEMAQMEEAGEDIKKVVRLVANEQGELVTSNTDQTKNDISEYISKKWCKNT